MMQATITPAGGGDDIELDNGSWRKIYGDFGISTGPDGLKFIVIDFMVTGNTIAEFQERCIQTQDDLNGLWDASIAITLDDAIDPDEAGGLRERIIPYQDGNGSTRTIINSHPEHPPTAVSEMFQLTFATVVQGKAGGTVGEPKLTISYEAGRVPTRTLLTTYASHEDYLAARTLLLTDWLLTAADGGRGSTASGLALTIEHEEQPDPDTGAITVLLQSESMPRALENSGEVRKYNLEVEVSQPERWHPEGGPTPLYLDVSGDVFVSAELLGSNTLSAYWWAKLRADIRRFARAEGGAASVSPIREVLSPDPKQSKIRVQCRYQAKNSTVLLYSKQVTVDLASDILDNKLSDGTDHVMMPKGDPPMTVTYRIVRLGLGDVEPSFHPPEQAGYSFLQLGKTRTIERVLTEFHADCFEQVLVVKFKRYKLRNPSGRPPDRETLVRGSVNLNP